MQIWAISAEKSYADEGDGQVCSATGKKKRERLKKKKIERLIDVHFCCRLFSQIERVRVGVCYLFSSADQSDDV